MKEKQNKRWALKLLSLLCAFLVWLGVVNVADPVMTDTVEVPVEIVNEELLTANDLTFEIVGKKTTTIVYEVKTTNAYRIRPADFRAYADMSDLWSVTGSIPVKVEVLNHSDYLVSEPISRTSTIKIETEPLQRKQFEVKVKTMGTMEDGYEVGTVTTNPEFVTMEGPESLIGQISSVGIEVSVDGLSADAEGTEKLVFYDANDNKVALSDRIQCDNETVSYQMTVLKVKNLTLDFVVSGEVAEGYRFTGVECEVKSVPVIGLKSVLASLNTIIIPGESLDITGARNDVVRTINLNDYLPTGVSLVGEGRSEINVIMTVERLEERIYHVEINDACYEGKKKEFIYRAEPDEISVRIRALSEELDTLELESSDLNVNVSMMDVGSYTVEPQLTLELGQVYEIVSISNCTINVMRMPEETEPHTGNGPGSEVTTGGESPEEEGDSGTHAIEANASAAEESDASKSASSETELETSAASGESE